MLTGAVAWVKPYSQAYSQSRMLPRSSAGTYRDVVGLTGRDQCAAAGVFALSGFADLHALLVQHFAATPCSSCPRICFAVPSVSTSALLGQITDQPAQGSGLIAGPGLQAASSGSRIGSSHHLSRRIRQALHFDIGFMA